MSLRILYFNQQKNVQYKYQKFTFEYVVESTIAKYKKYSKENIKYLKFYGEIICV